MKRNYSINGFKNNGEALNWNEILGNEVNPRVFEENKRFAVFERTEFGNLVFKCEKRETSQSIA